MAQPGPHAGTAVFHTLSAPTLRTSMQALIEKRDEMVKTYSVSGFARRAHVTRAINEIADALRVPRPPAPRVQVP